MESWDHWESLHGADEALYDTIQQTLRLKVPNGWLYLVKCRIDGYQVYEGQLAMQFVPDPLPGTQANMPEPEESEPLLGKSRRRQK